jgi:hypothetical protein
LRSSEFNQGEREEVERLAQRAVQECGRMDDLLGTLYGSYCAYRAYDVVETIVRLRSGGKNDGALHAQDPGGKSAAGRRLAQRLA